jgi:Skp family chaperone for outer membrane proteins
MNKFLMLGVAAVSMAVAAPAMAEGTMHKGKYMFSYHDTDSNGVVTKAEFMAKAEEKFAKMDTDGDGSISKAEHEAKKAEWKEKMKEHRAKKQQPAPTPAPAPAE